MVVKNYEKVYTKPCEIKYFDKNFFYTVPKPQSHFLQLYLSLHLNDKPDGTQTMLAELELDKNNIIDKLCGPRKEMKLCLPKKLLHSTL